MSIGAALIPSDFLDFCYIKFQFIANKLLISTILSPLSFINLRKKFFKMNFNLTSYEADYVQQTVLR